MATPPLRQTQAAADRLRDIESVTDVELSDLDVEDLLAVLLDRVKDILRVDTAAVLLLDDPTGQLVATAARGVEDAVHHGFRLPVGEGFAGRVAATRRPVTIEDVQASDVANPVLRDKGIRSLLGVPLLVGGRLIGVLHVGTLEPRNFEPGEVDLLQLAAERVALATEARRSEQERRAVLVLQHSLLPERLSPVPGLEAAARYSAGGEAGVGGDWYDMFTLTSGWVCITMGDVAGRGLRAAAVMGRLRSGVRAYALVGNNDPAEILTRVDRMVQHFEPGEMATVAVALLEPSFERLHVSLAGHPAPILAAPARPGSYVELPVDPPIGVDARGRRRSTVIEVPTGSVICFYTDGLIERRGTSLDARIAELCATVTARSVEQVCTAVMARLIGADAPSDDVAVLALRRLDGGPAVPLELSFPAVATSLRGIRAAIQRWVVEAGATPTDVAELLIAVGEATSNVVEHAYGPEGGVIRVRLELEERDVVVTVRDTGRWRPPRGEDRGRGTQLMESVSDELRIHRSAVGTEVVMRLRLGREVGP